MDMFDDRAHADADAGQAEVMREMLRAHQSQVVHAMNNLDRRIGAARRPGIDAGHVDSLRSALRELRAEHLQLTRMLARLDERFPPVDTR